MKPDTKYLLSPELKSQLMHLVMQRHAQALIEEQEELTLQAKPVSPKPAVKAAINVPTKATSEQQRKNRDAIKSLIARIR